MRIHSHFVRRSARARSFLPAPRLRSPRSRRRRAVVDGTAAGTLRTAAMVAGTAGHGYRGGLGLGMGRPGSGPRIGLASYYNAYPNPYYYGDPGYVVSNPESSTTAPEPVYTQPVSNQPVPARSSQPVIYPRTAKTPRRPRRRRERLQRMGRQATERDRRRERLPARHRGVHGRTRLHRSLKHRPRRHSAGLAQIFAVVWVGRVGFRVVVKSSPAHAGSARKVRSSRESVGSDCSS